MSELKLLTAKHAIVTKECRENKGDEGALDEVLERLVKQYFDSLDAWGDKANYHFKLEIEVLV